MKKLIITLIATFALSGTYIFAQCGEPLLKQAIKEMGSGQYIKDFSIELKKENKATTTGFAKYQIVLNSRTKYNFNIANSTTNAEKAIIQIYDGPTLIGTNLNDGKTYGAFEIIIGKTKLYSLQVSYKGGAEGCSAVVLSLLKQYSANEELK